MLLLFLSTCQVTLPIQQKEENEQDNNDKDDKDRHQEHAKENVVLSVMNEGHKNEKKSASAQNCKTTSNITSTTIATNL